MRLRTGQFVEEGGGGKRQKIRVERGRERHRSLAETANTAGRRPPGISRNFLPETDVNRENDNNRNSVSKVNAGE
jgi:hypothetical protein